MKRRHRRKTKNLIMTLVLLVAVVGITVFAGKFILNSFGPKEGDHTSTPQKEVKKHNTIFGEESKENENSQDPKSDELKKEEQSAQKGQKPQEQVNQEQINSQKQENQAEQAKDQKRDQQEKVKQNEKQEEHPNQAFSLSPSYNETIANQFSFVKNDATSIYVMLNKKNGLPEGYKPANLVVPNIDFPFSHDTPKKYMRAEAASALEKLFEAAKSQGHQLYGISGYRSYETQKGLYDMYVKKDGKEAADRYSSKPGYSEHQSGLVMDISSKAGGFDLQESFGELEEGKWVAQNAHKYGFIVRYLKDKVHITGYDYEPWHLRYVGEEVASYMFENNLCYEEFYDIIGVEYNK